MVDPEGDPGQRHNEDRGKVGLEDEEADVPAQLEGERESLVGPCHTQRNGLPFSYSGGIFVGRVKILKIIELKFHMKVTCCSTGWPIW